MELPADISMRDIAVARALQDSPNCYQWSWQLKGGTSLKVEIVGRWDDDDAKQVKTVLGMISDIVALGVDPRRAIACTEDKTDAKTE